MIDNTKEYLLCAAILRKEPRAETNLSNVDIHKCEVGIRHCDIIHRFRGELQITLQAQSFLTSRGRFVTRAEGECIARLCGQVEGNLIGGELTSEDLY